MLSVALLLVALFAVLVPLERDASLPIFRASDPWGHDYWASGLRCRGEFYVRLDGQSRLHAGGAEVEPEQLGEMACRGPGCDACAVLYVDPAAKTGAVVAAIDELQKRGRRIYFTRPRKGMRQVH